MAQLAPAATTGLSAAEVAGRISRGEVNGAPHRASRSAAHIVRANVFTFFNAIIGALCLLILIFGRLPDAIFGLVIVANTGIGIVQELRAKRVLDKLAVVGEEPVRVLRDGREVELRPGQIVLGDHIQLAAGERLAVDGEVSASAGLEIDESLLTGEADPVPKGDGDLVLSGSFVTAGSGAYTATRVGRDAYAARVVEQASAFSMARSELRSGIDRFLRLITWVILPVAILLAVSQLITAHAAFGDAVSRSVAGIVTMVPEGLVLLTSIAFAVGVIRLARRGCLVQELPAIEVLARVDVLCVDKTGTLTEGGMELAEVRDFGGAMPVRHALAALAHAEARPNPTLQAIAAGVGDDPGWRPTTLVPFSSARKWSGAVFQGGPGRDDGADHGIEAAATHFLDGTMDHGLHGSTDHGLDGAADHGLNGAAEHGPDGATDHRLDGTADHGLNGAMDDGLDGAANHGPDQGLDAAADHGLERAADRGLDGDAVRTREQSRASGTTVGGEPGEPGGWALGEPGGWVLGAPDVLLADGHPVRAEAERLASAGLRVLLAGRVAAARLDDADALPGNGVQPAGLVVLRQRLRAEAAATLRYFADQGVAVKVVSGDNPASVGAVAAALGVPGAANPVDARTLPGQKGTAGSAARNTAENTTGTRAPADPEREPADAADLRALSRSLEQASVFGRVSPQQKRSFVAALQAAGHTVAMTGDGVNDVLALKDADLGVAMGSGSGASRAVAKVVLMQDDFAALPHVVGEGRRVLGNIERIATLFLCKAVYAVLLALAVSVTGLIGLAGLKGLEFPFLPRHLTLVSTLTIGIPAFVLALAPNTRRARPGFVSRVMRFAAPAGIACAAATFTSYLAARLGQGTTLAGDRSTATIALFTAALGVLLLVARPWTWWRVTLIAAMAALFAGTLAVPWARGFFALSTDSARDYLTAVLPAAAAITALAAGLEARKHRRLHGSRGQIRR